PVGPPDELVVLGIRDGDVHRLVRGDVEEERAGGLDDGGPPSRAAAIRDASVGPGKPALQRSAGGKKDRANEEGDSVGRLADKLYIAWKRADQETGRPERKAQRHPPLPTHGAFSAGSAAARALRRLDRRVRGPVPLVGDRPRRRCCPVVLRNV